MICAEIAQLGEQSEPNENVEAYLRRDLPNFVLILLLRRFEALLALFGPAHASRFPLVYRNPQFANPVDVNNFFQDVIEFIVKVGKHLHVLRNSCQLILSLHDRVR